MTGNAAAEALKARIATLAPDWPLHFGQWQDAGPQSRAIVIRPMGGGGGDLVRRPVLSLTLIGSTADSSATVSAVAEAVRVDLDQDAPGVLMWSAVSEPTALASSDGRPVFELGVNCILE